MENDKNEIGLNRLLSEGSTGPAAVTAAAALNIKGISINETNETKRLKRVAYKQFNEVYNDGFKQQLRELFPSLNIDFYTLYYSLFPEREIYLIDYETKIIITVDSINNHRDNQRVELKPLWSDNFLSIANSYSPSDLQGDEEVNVCISFRHFPPPPSFWEERLDSNLQQLQKIKRLEDEINEICELKYEKCEHSIVSVRLLFPYSQIQNLLIDIIQKITGMDIQTSVGGLKSANYDC